MQQIHTARGMIAYEDHRNSDQQIPLVLIHGAGDTCREWAPELKEGLHALALDLPGHGGSPAPGQIRVADYAADIAAFLDALHIEKAIIAGHSMGGAIAQTMALDYPAKTAAIILLATGARLAVNPAIIDGMLQNPEETLWMITRWSWEKSVDEAVKKQSHLRQLQIAPEITRGDYIACSMFDVRERLHEIAVPAFILAGEHDKMTPLALGEELAARITHADLIVIPNGGHRFPLEQPLLVQKHIETWLAQHR